MDYRFTNLSALKIFIRDLEEFGLNSEIQAEKASNYLRDIILARVEGGKFTGGIWANKPYSTNPIKAFKLGNVNITGKGKGKSMSINGMVISDDDWTWGGMNKDGTITTQSGLTIDAMFAPSPQGDGGNFNKAFSDKPAPVFIPGYRGWVVKYNGLSGNVDLDFSGSMLDNFDIVPRQAKGSNQYGGNYIFEVETPFEDITEITNFYREWVSISDDDIRTIENMLGDSFKSFK